MQGATGLELHYVIADPKYVNNIFKQNTLNAIDFKLYDLLYSDNLKVVITQLCHELQVCNFTML